VLQSQELAVVAVVQMVPDPLQQEELVVVDLEETLQLQMVLMEQLTPEVAVEVKIQEEPVVVLVEEVS
jgi:hypothetical protein